MDEVVAVAPGRANLIGEYTDVNDGFVLPVALNLCTTVTGRRSDRVVLRSAGQAEIVEVDLQTGVGPRDGWGRYVTAVIQVLRAAGLPLLGVHGQITSDVPLGAGLSSSAALEVAVATAVLAEPLPPVEIALLCQRAENEGVGVRSGIMDQLSSAGGRAGHALLLDCRNLDMQHVPMPPGLSVLVLDSGVTRRLRDGAYNERIEACRAAAVALGVASLRELEPGDLQPCEGRLPAVLFRRVRHVVTENARVIAAAGALQTGDTAALGPLFAASHRSLAQDFEVSTPELDSLVQIAAGTTGVLASRMTGAGFGGCTVSLVRSESAAAAAEHVIAQYTAGTHLPARAWICSASDGARRTQPV